MATTALYIYIYISTSNFLVATMMIMQSIRTTYTVPSTSIYLSSTLGQLYVGKARAGLMCVSVKVATVRQ